MISLLAASEVSIEVGPPDARTAFACVLAGLAVFATIAWFASHTRRRQQARDRGGR